MTKKKSRKRKPAWMRVAYGGRKRKKQNWTTARKGKRKISRKF